MRLRRCSAGFPVSFMAPQYLIHQKHVKRVARRQIYGEDNSLLGHPHKFVVAALFQIVRGG